MTQMIRPGSVVVWYRGNPYRVDLERCRHAFARLVVAGELRGMRDLARRLGIRHSTAARFFAGRDTSLTVTLKILEAVELTMADVGRPLGDDPTDRDGGAAGGRVRRGRRPPPGDGGAVVADVAP